MHFLSYSKTLVLSALLSVVSFSSINSMELLKASSVSSPEPVQLFSNRRNLFVQDENAAHRVDEKHNMNPLLQEVMKRQAMGKFTENGGYLRVKQLSDGQYALEAKVRGDGGGAICAWWAYNFAKGAMYGSAAVAAGTVISGAVIASGGGVIPAAIAGGAGKVISLGVGAATAGGSVSAGIASAALASGTTAAVGASNVALVAGSVVASSGSTAGVVATVELASLGFAAIFAGPWCP